jgi:hypothetical protein
MKSLDALLSRVAEMQAKAKQRAADRQRECVADLAKPCNVVQLPIWPEPTRGVPNVALRSALFGAIRKGARPYLERVEIHSQEGFKLRYTGARLDQGDLDGWETVLHVVRVQALGDECRVTGYQLLKAMGKTDTGGNREVLDKRLARMKATALEVQAGHYSYMGSLIDEVYKDEESREYVIRLNPKLRALFELDQFTQIDWTVRHALDGKPLAQWLHGYYASHAKPYPVNVATLLKLSGSENEDPSSGRQKLRKAMDALTDASEANNQPFSYTINGDLVHVEKLPSGAQRRHLTKKKAPRPRKS